MLPARPRLRTTRPKTWPFVSWTRQPAMNGVVAIIMGGDPSDACGLCGPRGRSAGSWLRAVVSAPPARLSFPDAPSRVIVARAAVAQQSERVIAGVVAVAPRRRDRVLADEVDVDEAGLLGGQLRPRSRASPACPASPRQNAHGHSQRRASAP